MSKTRTFLTLFSIISILLSVSHIVHFASPLLEMTADPDIPESGDDMTAMEFLKMAQFFDEYDWEEYDSEDFPDWLYMPSEYPSELNASEDALSPWAAYDWDSYDPNDFPNWMNAPAELPVDFDEDDEDDFIITYMDEDYMNEVLELMGSETDTESGEISAEQTDITSFIHPLEAIYGLIWIAVAVISLILSRSVN